MRFINKKTYTMFLDVFAKYGGIGKQRLGQYFCNYFNIYNDSTLFYARHDNEARKIIESNYVNWQE